MFLVRPVIVFWDFLLNFFKQFILRHVFWDVKVIDGHEKCSSEPTRNSILSKIISTVQYTNFTIHQKKIC